jgi:hypothetical protein
MPRATNDGWIIPCEGIMTTLIGYQLNVHDPPLKSPTHIVNNYSTEVHHCINKTFQTSSYYRQGEDIKDHDIQSYTTQLATE